MHRDLTWQEKGLIDAGCLVHAAIKFDSHKYIDQIIDTLLKTLPQFHYYIDDTKTKIICDNNKYNLYDNVFNLKIDRNASMNDIAKSSFDNAKPKNNKLASISIFSNENVIVLNISHAVADGAFLKDLIQNLQTGALEYPLRFSLPLTPLDTIKRELETCDPSNEESDFDPMITTFRSKGKKKENGSNALNHFAFEIPIKKFDHLSERVWLAHPLSVYAVDNYINNKNNTKDINNLGCGTLVNLRPYIQKTIFENNKNNILNHFSWINVGVENVSEKMKIPELKQKVRECFKQKMSKECYFSSIKNLYLPSKHNSYVPLEKTTVSTSNVGIIKLNKPCNDVFITQNAERFARNCISLINYGVVNDFSSKLNCSITYGDQIISEDEAKKIGKAISTYFKYIDDSFMTVRDAINMIEKVL